MPKKEVTKKQVEKRKEPSNSKDKEKLYPAIIYLSKGKWGLEVYVKPNKPELYTKNHELIGKREEDGTITLKKEFLDKIRNIEGSELLNIDENIEAGVLHVEEPKKEIASKKKAETKKPPVENKEKNVEKIEEDIGLKKGDILACTRLENLEEFDEIVPTARKYQDIQLAHTKDGEMAFYGLNAKGQYEQVDGTNIARTTNKVVNKIAPDGKSIREEAITGLVTLNGENQNEYAFSVNYDYHELEVNLIRLQREADTYKIGLAHEIETDMQRPSTREMDEVMKEENNPYIDDEMDREKQASNMKEEIELNDITEKTSYNESMIRQSIKEDTLEQLRGKSIGLSEIRGFIRGQVIARMGAGYERIEEFTSEIKEDIDLELEREEEEFIPPSYRKEKNL